MVLLVSYSGLLGGAERLLVDFAEGLEGECAIACPPGALDDAARARGLRTFRLQTRSLRLRGRPARALADLVAHGAEVARLCAALSPEVVVAWGMRTALVAPVAGRGAGELAFQHNDFLPGRVIGGFVRVAAKRMDLVTAPSRAVLCDLGRLDSRAQVIAPGVDVGRFDASASPASPPEVLVVGALTEWKRPDVALEAFAAVRREFPQARLRLAGAPVPDDPPIFVERLHSRAAMPDLAGAVEFAGQVSDVASALARATCLLHCAKREPFGIAVLEAMAAGRPVVVPAAAGPAEIVDDACARTYTPSDAGEAAQALASILRDPEGARRLGEAGRARARERFTLSAQRARYREAVAGLRRRPDGKAGAGVALITVTHNSAGELEALLRSVSRHLPRARVVVADCASSDDTLAVAWRHPGVHVLELENVGFGRACNRALDEIDEPVTALVNPDVELIDGSLSALAAEVAAAGRPERLLAPLVLNDDGSRQDTVHPAPLSAAEIVRSLVPPAALPGRFGVALAPWRSRGPRRVGWAVGCALVTRTDVLRRLGPFEESIFLYGEDMELGLRAARAGIETWFWPAGRVIHHGGHSIEAAYGGEPYGLRARARHDAVALALGRSAARADDVLQVVTFSSRLGAKRALGRPAVRERRQLRAVLGRRDGAGAPQQLVTSRPVTASWEEFAQRDPQYYIDPTLGPGVGVDEFREGGRGIVDWAVGWAGELPSHARALEIGCGMGRNTVHLARHFDHVDGVDVSPTMVAAALEHGVPENVALHALSGRDLRPLPDGAFALAFSHLVFQHVESADDVAAYVREVGRVLMPGGVAVLHFDSRPQSLLVTLARHLPDALLPRDRRRGIRRQRRDPGQIRAWGRAAGLVLEAEAEAGSDRHWVRWRRPTSG